MVTSHAYETVLRRKKTKQNTTLSGEESESTGCDDQLRVPSTDEEDDPPSMSSLVPGIGCTESDLMCTNGHVNRIVWNPFERAGITVPCTGTTGLSAGISIVNLPALVSGGQQ